jgi:hypothetical protein
MHIDRNLARSSCVALLLTTACATAPARHVEPMPVAAPAPEMTEGVGSSFSLFPQLARDAGQLATARLRWDRSDWTKLGVGALAVAGALLLDEDLREIVHRNTNDTTRGLAKAAGPFGAEYSFATLGAFYLAGKYLKDDRAKAVAEDGIASSLIAAGVITPILKATVGRRRPSQTEVTFARGNGGVSFPSGHATRRSRSRRSSPRTTTRCGSKPRRTGWRAWWACRGWSRTRTTPRTFSGAR